MGLQPGGWGVGARQRRAGGRGSESDEDLVRFTLLVEYGKTGAHGEAEPAEPRR